MNPLPSRAPHHAWRDALPLLLLGAAVTIFLAPLLRPGVAPFLRDILRTYYPLRRYIVDRLSHGELPQWFPYEGLGEPLLGQVVDGTFHPATLLYFVFPLITATKVEIILSFLFGAAGQYLLGRKLGLGQISATFSSIALCFSGYFVSLSDNLLYLRGVATIPWVCWCIANMLTEKSVSRWLVASATCWASILLGGDFNEYLFAALPIVMTAISMDHNRKRTPLLVVAGGLSMLLTAFIWLPAQVVHAQSLMSRMTNPRGLSLFWSLNPLRLPELFISSWTQDPSTSSLVANLPRGENGQWARSIFAGTVVMALALTSIKLPFRQGGAWAALAAIGLWLSLGLHGGLDLVLRHAIPIINYIRYPQKNISFWILGTSMAAAYALQATLSDQATRRRCYWVFVFFISLLSATLAFSNVQAVRHILDAWLQHVLSGGDPTKVVSTWTEATSMALVFSLLGAVALAASAHRPQAVAVIPIIAFLQLWTGNGDLIPIVPSSLITDEPLYCSEAQKAIQGDHGLRVITASRHQPVYFVEADGPLWVGATRNAMQPDDSASCSVTSLGGIPNLPGEPARLRDVFTFEPNNTLAQSYLFGFNLIVSQEPLPDAALLVSNPVLPFSLWYRPGAPRAFLGTPRFVSSPLAALRAVRTNPGALIADPVVEGVAGGHVFTPANGVATIVVDTPEHVEINTDSDKSAALILNDQNYPGWRATVDGIDAPIMTANYLVRAVLVPSGHHRVDFIFKLPGLRFGTIITAFGFIICISLLIAAHLLAPRTAIQLPED